jgi:ADP-ribose pyrophosphatase YjhB (NUDIX family)
MRYTARAIIIKNKAILLVTGHGANFYWTPGGKIETGESSSKALLRELQEELLITDVKIKKYLSYEIKNQNVINYLVDTPNEPKPNNEVTNIIYFTKANFYNNDINISEGLEKILIPSLIKDGLL